MRLEDKLAFSEWAKRPKVKVHPDLCENKWPKSGMAFVWVGLVKDLREALEKSV